MKLGDRLPRLKIVVSPVRVRVSPYRSLPANGEFFGAGAALSGGPPGPSSALVAQWLLCERLELLRFRPVELLSGLVDAPVERPPVLALDALLELCAERGRRPGIGFGAMGDRRWRSRTHA